MKTTLALSRYYLGIPWNRMDAYQRMVGVPVPDSTQWELVSQLFFDVRPVIIHLIEMAAQCKIVFHDDTTGRILSLIEENKNLPEGARYGMHSTGMVTIGEHTIILYFTGRAHAGENLDKLMDLRDEGLPKVKQMSDALNANGSKRHKENLIRCLCNSHAVRKFKEIRENFPDACDSILETMKDVFINDKHTKDEQMTDQERMDYHIKNSEPLLKELKTWMEEQQGKYHNIEQNSTLGHAINYMLNSWECFTRFLTVPGAPLENNIVERALKRLIFQRKNSYFFKNEYTAYIGCSLTSLIMTTVESGINPYEYLNCLQENWKAVEKNPTQWLPWNFHENFITQQQAA